MREGKVYVGGLPHDATSEELEGAFSRYGRLKKVWVARRPPGFAFVEFEDIRDAEDAVRALNGQRICGVRARVELSTGYRRSEGSRGGGHGNNADRNNGFMRAYNDRYERRSGGRDRSRTPPRRSRSPRGSPRYEEEKKKSPSRSRSRSLTPER